MILAGGFDALECLPLADALGRRVEIHMGSPETLIKTAHPATRYDLVLIDCGINWVKVPSDELVAALRAFVADGGRLMLTDLAYPLLEFAWPDLVDFDGPGARAGEPQRPEGASLGPEGDVEADVVDDGLARNLGRRHFTAERLQGDWAVMREVSPDARVFVRAEALGRVRPLAVAADFPGGGRVVYASFHGHAREADPERCSAPTGEPTERALVYMMAYALAPAQAAAPPRPVAARPPREVPEPRSSVIPLVREDPDIDVQSVPRDAKPPPRPAGPKTRRTP